MISDLELRPRDIHPDGKRYPIFKESPAEPTEGTSGERINIVLNWFEELMQLVPVP